MVTAGLVLLIKFNILTFFRLMSICIFFFGLLTMFFSSLSSLIEVDYKKVVALSTLSQIGFSIMTIGLGYFFISFLHLISHALFKSCLFIQIGYIIHASNGQQDGRYYNNNGNLPYFIQLQVLITLFCLCGLFFSSGIIRKDVILEIFFFGNNNFLVSIFFFLTVFITFFYCYRL